jgi:hypothetical protein
VEQPEPQPRPRLDQRAALEELARCGRDIQEYRLRREALGDQFETFVQSFKTPPAAGGRAEAPPIAPVTAAASAPVPVDAPVVAPLPAEPPRNVASAALDAPPAADAAPEPAPLAQTETARAPEPAWAPPRERRGTPRGAIAAGAAVILGGGLIAALWWNRSPEPSAEPAAAVVAPSAVTPAPSPAPAPAAPPPQAAAPLAAAPGQSTIVTERQVWMRVIVDGARVLEREVPAGTTIPLKAENTIVIRTGDAGAVRLSLRGAPGALLGREGEVVTRSFTVPPRSGDPR